MGVHNLLHSTFYSRNVEKVWGLGRCVAYNKKLFHTFSVVSLCDFS